MPTNLRETPDSITVITAQTCAHDFAATGEKIRLYRAKSVPESGLKCPSTAELRDPRPTSWESQRWCSRRMSVQWNTKKGINGTPPALPQNGSVERFWAFLNAFQVSHLVERAHRALGLRRAPA